ncbi:lysophospholipase L1-like esterase [Okibacterium sp. HSC-33S16]|uniref:SGNH/GDSL hydrolase family protein n=1 Tax=Okibacterium sp. HSC-33S16 TaxID=2910965 RepID=UPI00209F9CAF|nr:SGNH/GDSL hydrolase family protein [Okibacterium sp. HSC-33S16]MCP2032728.1 lysophospholipase L1-like esterase [Okibacterium sp. HSC-33S16]
MERIAGADAQRLDGSPTRRRVLLRVGVPVVIAAVLAAAFFVLSPRPAVVTGAAADSAGGTIAAAADPALSLASFADARDLLSDADRTFVVQVIGDSTGNEPGEWVDVAFRALAVELDRPLVQHPWDVLSTSYLSPIRSNDDAPNALLEVWNGSASGKTAAYSLANFGALVPVQPDLVILNHGLNNVLAPAQVGDEFTALIAELERSWPSQIGYAALLENPRLDQYAAAHEDVIAHVSEWLTEHPEVRSIDVRSAYLDSPDLPLLLLPDLLHPTPAGSALTAATVLDAIEH